LNTIDVMFPLRFAAIVLGGCLLAACAAPAAAPSPTVRFTPIPTAAPSGTPLATPAATFAPKFDELPVAANEPVMLSQQLVVVERALRNPSITGAQLKWFGHLEQLIFSRLADFPEWRPGVIGTLPAEIQEPVRKGIDAGDQLRKMGGSPAKALPPWTIVTPPAPEDLLRFYREAEASFGVPWYYLASIMLIESRMGRIRGDSSAGAQGPMQFIPSTWAAYGQGDVNDPRDSIFAGARYLKAAGAPGDMPRAIFAYNHSSHYVNGVIAYAEAMKLDENAFRGYYGWQVYYWMEEGPILLPEGWKKG
jgi:soluble lytic murein transglycosylase-like protein